MQVAAISNKTPTTNGYFRNWMPRPSFLDLCYPHIHSIFTLFLIKQNFEKKKSSRAGSQGWVQFWPRMTPDYKKPLRKIEYKSTLVKEISAKLYSLNIMENLRPYPSKEQIWKTLPNFLFMFFISYTIPFNSGWAQVFNQVFLPTFWLQTHDTGSK